MPCLAPLARAGHTGLRGTRVIARRHGYPQLGNSRWWYPVTRLTIPAASRPVRCGQAEVRGTPGMRSAMSPMLTGCRALMSRLLARRLAVCRWPA